MKLKLTFSLLLMLFATVMALCRPSKGLSANPYTQPGIFLNYGFSVDSMTDANIQSVVEWLEVRNFRKQFMNVGTLNSDGTLSASNYTQLSHWISVSRATQSDQQIIAYVSGSLSLVNTPSAWANIAKVCNMFINTYHVDGVNLDFEPYSTSAANMIGMLKAIRNKIGWTANLSMDYTADSSAFWSGPDFNTVSGYVNYMMLMLYDSSSTTVAQYNAFIDTSMNYAYNWKVHGCGIVPIFPVYASSPTHDPSIENIQTCASEVWKLAQVTGSVQINDVAVWWYYGWNGSNYGYNSMDDPTDNLWWTYWLDQ